MQSSGTFNRAEIYAGDRHLATYEYVPQQLTVFIHPDWLGTERMRSKYDGTLYQTCVNLPFGDSQTCTTASGAADPSPLHFTGKMRDTETNLDYFGARYYSSGMARWMSPDWASKPTEVPYANFGDPQSLNLYGYVENDPLGKTDKDGHDSDGPCFCLTVNPKQAGEMAQDVFETASSLGNIARNDAASGQGFPLDLRTIRVILKRRVCCSRGTPQIRP